MTQDRPVLGIALMLGFCLMAPLGDSLAKLLGGRIELVELVTIRMIAQFIICAPIVWLASISITMDGRLFRIVALRSMLHILAIGLMFLSLRYLPLADAVAIAFVMPFIMLLLGFFVLKEEVGHRRIIACAVGFVGTLMVMQPSFVEVGWPAMLPVGVAVVFALFMLVTRQIAKDVDPIALQLVSATVAVSVLLPALLIFSRWQLPGFALTMPSLSSWWMVAAMGALGTCGHLAMTWALRFAPSATLAPMQYLEIPVAALLGWLIFSDFPNGLALWGIAVTMAAGLYIIAREQKLSRLSRQSPPVTPPLA